MILKDRFNQLFKNTPEPKAIEGNKYRLYVIICFLCFVFFPIKNIWVNYRIIAIDGRSPRVRIDWVYHALNHKEKYAKSINSRKIVLLSGSSGLFGLSAEQIEKETGIPTVNFAVNAGLTVDYLAWKLAPILKEGDIIIMAPEYNYYYKNKVQQISTDIFTSYIISYDPKYLESLNLIYQALILLRPVTSKVPDLDLINFASKYIQNDLDAITGKSGKEEVKKGLIKTFEAGKCYTGLSLNLNGDETCNIGNKNKAPFKDTINAEEYIEEIDKTGEIKDFIQFAKEKKVTLIPIYPGIKYEPKYLTEKYHKFFAKIAQFWRDQKVIFTDKPEDSFIPGDEMLESRYHPTDQGRKTRTTKVIKLLENMPDLDLITPTKTK